MLTRDCQTQNRICLTFLSLILTLAILCGCTPQFQKPVAAAVPPNYIEIRRIQPCNAPIFYL